MKFSKKKNINRITSSDSNTDKCNYSKCNKDIINEVLQELIIEEERKVYNIEKSII